MNRKFDKIISNTLRNMVLENGEILTKGAFGSGGRSKAFVANVKARAESDAKGLMSDLGISGIVAGSDLEKVQKILNAAIHSNTVMGQAYSGTRMITDVPSGEEKEKKAVAIALSQIDRKNGIRFLAHTLTAAKNAGFLRLKKSVQFSTGESNPVIIYSVEQ